MARSTHKPIISITKIKSAGATPTFVTMGHRHFQKEVPTDGVRLGGAVEFTMPVDLLGVTIPADLARDIEEVTIGYKASQAV